MTRSESTAILEGNLDHDFRRYQVHQISLEGTPRHEGKRDKGSRSQFLASIVFPVINPLFGLGVPSGSGWVSNVESNHKSLGSRA